MQLFWHLKVFESVGGCRSLKETFRLYFQGSAVQLFNSFALKDELNTFFFETSATTQPKSQRQFPDVLNP
jgi:hypothetical protein